MSREASEHNKAGGHYVTMECVAVTVVRPAPPKPRGQTAIKVSERVRSDVATPRQHHHHGGVETEFNDPARTPLPPSPLSF